MKKYLLFLLSALIFATACTKKSSKGDYGLDVNETLRVNITSEPPTLDWNKATDTTSSRVLNNIMEGLTTFDYSDKDLGVKPALAESWEMSEKGKKWVFHLRKNVTWNDGTPFVAKHLIDGWIRLITPETASEYAYFLYAIKNAKAFSEGKVKDITQLGMKATDDFTIEVELDAPMTFFPSLLTHASTYPIRLDLIQKNGDQWTEAGKIVTIGAYNLKSWEHDKAIVLERNDKYFGEPAKTKNILMYMIGELATAVNLFESGKLDALDELPKTDLKSFESRPQHKVHPTLVLQYYGFNTKKAPFNNIDVRKAFAHAVDKQELVNIMGSGDVPLTSWVPAGMFGYEADIGLKFDVAKAKEYLKKAGYSDVTKLPKISISFNTNENHQRIAENIQAQFKKNLGISVEVKNEEWKVYLATLKSDTPPIFRMGWQADYPDPDNFMNLMTSYSQNNRTHWGNKDFDKLIEQAVTEADKSKRKEYYRKAQKIMLEDDVSVIPLFSSSHHLMVADRVQDYPVNPLNSLEYKTVTLKK